MNNIDYEHGTFTILDTDICQFTYEDYLEYCEDMGLEPMGDNSGDYFNWCREETDCNVESDLENIKYCKQYNVPVVITGKLGLWDGKHEIEPVYMDSVYDAITKCMDGADDVKADYVDGEIVVYAYHHDGTNFFRINAVDEETDEVKRLPYLYAIGI